MEMGDPSDSKKNTIKHIQISSKGKTDSLHGLEFFLNRDTNNRAMKIGFGIFNIFLHFSRHFTILHPS